MIKITFTDIEPFLGANALVLGNKSFTVTNVGTVENVNKNSLDWVNPLKKNKSEYLVNSKANVILCEHGVLTEDVDLEVKCIIHVENPKLTFIRIVNHFFNNNELHGIHPTAVIHPEAKIGNNSYIGPNTYIGKCTIGKGAIIHGNCYLYDNVTIGENVIILAGAVIGLEGFGYQRNESGEYEKFPHIGGVIIGDNVDIGSNTTIDRGALGNTVIEDGVKIDHLVHIAHNVKVEKHTAITALAMIGGSTEIGQSCWIAPSAVLRDQIQIGEKSKVGMGAVVTKNIPEGETWAGNPARKFEK